MTEQAEQGPSSFYSSNSFGQIVNIQQTSFVNLTLNNSWQANGIFFFEMRKSAREFSSVGKTKIKANKSHLAACPLDPATLGAGVTRRHRGAWCRGRGRCGTSWLQGCPFAHSDLSTAIRALEVRELMTTHSPKPGHQCRASPGFQHGAAPAAGLGVTDGGLGQSGEGAPTHTPVPLRDVTVPPLGRLLLHGTQRIPKGKALPLSGRAPAGQTMMPDPQGPQTCTSPFACITRAEQLLDLVMRDSPEEI